MSKVRNATRLEIERLEDRELLAGSIFFSPYAGTVTIDGTAGNDTAHVRKTADGKVEVSATFGSATYQRYYSPSQLRGVSFHGFEGNDRFTNYTLMPSTIFGGANNDTLIGGGALDQIFGGSGNDHIQGLGGNDSVYGYTGDDVLSGGDGNDRLYGGLGVDRLNGGTGSNIVDGSATGPYTGWVSITEESVLSSRLSVLEREVIGYTNLEREKRGLPLLKLNVNLLAAAQYHATNMAKENKMEHVLSGVTYPDLASRLDHFGYDYRTAGENIAWNFFDARSVVAAWMNSPGHRANILDANFEEIGVGMRFNSHGEPYYCQNFGARR